MFFGVGFCFILLMWQNYALHEIKDSIKKKNLRFVETLKRNLEINNDDYKEVVPHNALQRNDAQQFIATSNVALGFSHNSASNRKATDALKISNQLKVTTAVPFNGRTELGKNDIHNQLLEKISRRVNNAFASKEKTIDKDTMNVESQKGAKINYNEDVKSKSTPILPVSNITIKKAVRKNLLSILSNKIEKKKLNQSKMVTKKYNNFPVLTTLQNSPSKIQMKSKQEQENWRKADRFETFLRQNKGLLKEFISSKIAILTPPTTLSPELRMKEVSILDNNDLNRAMQEFMGSLEKFPDSNETPTGDMLDMLPARGGRIHQKRLRVTVQGRLCQRHVLLPEGPKYDSKGLIYLPPHAEILTHQFNNTRPPQLLLPRCCNCCRKSVLGCE